MFDFVSFLQGAIFGSTIVIFMSLFVYSLIKDRQKNKLNFTPGQLYAIWHDAWRYVLFLVVEQEWDDSLEKYAEKRAKDSFKEWHNTLFK